MRNQIRKILIAAGAICALSRYSAQAFTGIRLVAGDGSVIHARTMEFAIDIHSEIMMSPRGFARRRRHARWQERPEMEVEIRQHRSQRPYLPVLVDGFKRKGPGRRHVLLFRRRRVHALHRADADKTIASYQLVSWILDNCASVEEVKTGVPNLVVPAVVLDAWKIVLEVHYVVHDITGKSVVNPVR